MQVIRIDDSKELELIEEEINSQFPVEQDLDKTTTLEEFIYGNNTNK